ncbi:hypothetical protein DBV15_10190 [Temnothorax longispinosus]|uniref:Uncharacterized protein n=1 Tax=Temnothorax longispinosus TaxID=300112 RepID=A0A4V3SBQ5_9HYME|nr:hypothetical protein DBV15_10190 [Temnothorax longispinosus]
MKSDSEIRNNKAGRGTRTRRLVRSWGGSKKGVEKDERNDGIKCMVKEGIHQMERARDRHAPSATIHVRKKEKERERDKKGWKDEKNKRNRPRCTVKRARDAPQDDVLPPPVSLFISRTCSRSNLWQEVESRLADRRALRKRVPGVHRAKCIRAAYRTAPAAGGPATPFLPPWCMYTYRATCVDLIRREVQRPCHVNEKSAVDLVRAREVMRKCKRCTRAFGHHVDDRIARKDTIMRNARARMHRKVERAFSRPVHGGEFCGRTFVWHMQQMIAPNDSTRRVGES